MSFRAVAISAMLRKLLNALFVFFLVFSPSKAGLAAALTADDLLVIYNKAVPESQAVAAHYAAKRQVPTENLIGLELPASESISRAEFETALLLPLAAAVEARMREGDLPPALLLVYGVPLKVKDGGGGKDTLRDLARAKADELSTLSAGLIDRLAKISPVAGSDLEPEAAPGGAEKVPALFHRARRLLDQTAALLRSNDAPVTAELASLLLQLTGLAPLASPSAADAGDKPPAKGLGRWKAVIESRLALLPFEGVTIETAAEKAALIRINQGLLGELRFWHTLAQHDPTEETGASVDSELSLLRREGFPAAKWLPNPFLPQFDNLPEIGGVRRLTLMVARLDGPTPEIAKRLVDEAVATERTGLAGVFYIDARGLPNDGERANSYSQYDSYLRNLRDLLAGQTAMPVVFDDTPELFAEPLPKAALYCGWYALRDYRDVFAWQPGAVGFHVASAEASTLRGKGSNVWCKRMLEEGVAATLGPVYEPYLQAFPRPDHFFPLLMSGRLTLLETYFRTTPYLSWRLVLIGDPLYNPFKNNPIRIALTGD